MSVSHIFQNRVQAPQGHEWTVYEGSLRDAMAYVETGQMKLALAALGYASTLPDSKRPDELERRALFREFCKAAGVWRSE